MLINIIKFIHLLSVLGVLGLALYSLATKQRLTKILLGLCVIAMLTGTLLIYPKHYTFQTHWIQAAYLLLSAFILGVLFTKKRTSYFVLVPILVVIIHDAVTKSTFF